MTTSYPLKALPIAAGFICLALLFIVLINPHFIIKGIILKSLPRYPKATSWKLILHKGSFFDDPEQTIISYDTNSGLNDVLPFYKNYLLQNGWILKRSEDNPSWGLLEHYNYYTKRILFLNFSLRLNWLERSESNRQLPCCQIVAE